MWTLIRFSLLDDAQYLPALGLLARAGFRTLPRPAADRRDPLPAAVVADRIVDPAVASRAVFEALLGAGLGPICVIGGNVGRLGLRGSPCARASGSGE